ncbi:hypothetical protein OS493_025033 [Desmophyllum pertusum]|uniref:Uncharacterized protein n=1 Tax=Desmophyllum pertusum TaxID=174260 RepID=A0A9W9YLV2_9CNID|nr:hypothetical protein OS493_025033 [Desmophyllum pertusum]
MDKCSDRQRLVSQPVFKEFLVSNAPTLYKNILDSILSERHGDKRANLQEKRATALIWQPTILQVFSCRSSQQAYNIHSISKSHTQTYNDFDKQSPAHYEMEEGGSYLNRINL